MYGDAQAPAVCALFPFFALLYGRQRSREKLQTIAERCKLSVFFWWFRFQTPPGTLGCCPMSPALPLFPPVRRSHLIITGRNKADINSPLVYYLWISIPSLHIAWRAPSQSTSRKTAEYIHETYFIHPRQNSTHSNHTHLFSLLLQPPFWHPASSHMQAANYVNLRRQSWGHKDKRYLVLIIIFQQSCVW